ncbi:MAG: hypothetical protein WBH40_18425, partial [Ignavibacteriaceae bacterium]
MAPDGTRIVFISTRDGNFEIYVMKADGSNLQRLTNNYYEDIHPDWSPDGDKIIFNSKINDDYGIYVMNADGSNQQSLLDTSAWELFPRWSPDGSKIVFFANISVSMSERNVYIMNNDGSNITQLTNTNAVDEDPDWSPDGTQIVFQSNRDNNYEIYIMNVDGANQIRLTSNPYGDYWPTWYSVTQVGIESNDHSINDNYQLSQNYPNPFNPNTTINYLTPKLSFVSPKVYDVVGNEIKTLVAEEKTAGSYE